MWRFYLDISIDLMIMGRVDTHLLGLFKSFNEKSDGDSSRFNLFLFSCFWLKTRTENRQDEETYALRTHCNT